jgi:hypothetical protein
VYSNGTGQLKVAGSVNTAMNVLIPENQEIPFLDE